MNDNTTCAYVDWDERWRTEAGPTDWVVPDEEVIERARAVHAAGARRALDHGCGIGRHDLAIANVGFDVDAFGVSQAGLAKIAAQTERHQLPINTHRGYMNGQLFKEARNDFIVSWFFFYHSGDAILRRAMARIYRVLKTNGTVLLTKLSKRNVGFGVGREDSTNFWADPDAELDKARPHCYYDTGEAIDLFDAFGIRSLVDIEQRGKSGYSHWHIVTERCA